MYIKISIYRYQIRIWRLTAPDQFVQSTVRSDGMLSQEAQVSQKERQKERKKEINTYIYTDRQEERKNERAKERNKIRTKETTKEIHT